MSWITRHWQLLFLIVAFVLTRFYIYSNPPLYYSDVKQDYERYANMWRYGLTPYREHLFEYPPATIPLLATPLSLDQAGIGKYYANYRAEILIVDSLFFVVLLLGVQNLVWTRKSGFSRLLIYLGLTTLAKDFYYEGIDLVFTASFFVAALMPVLVPNNLIISDLLTFIFFWLSTAIKFLTAPLLLPLAWLRHRRWHWSILMIVLGFFIVWGVPLAKYGSSLQVSFVWNFSRPLKYASFPSHVIQWMNFFTETETQVQKAPDFEYVGPVSTLVTQVTKVVFPLSIFLWLLGSLGIIFQHKLGSLQTFVREKLKVVALVELIKAELTQPKVLAPDQQVFLSLKMYGLYIFTLFLTAKIFSQPFHIWYFPLVVLFPFKKVEHTMIVVAAMTWMVAMDMTTLLHVPNAWRESWSFLPLLRDSLRFVPMILVIYFFWVSSYKKPTT